MQTNISGKEQIPYVLKWFYTWNKIASPSLKESIYLKRLTRLKFNFLCIEISFLIIYQYVSLYIPAWNYTHLFWLWLCMIYVNSVNSTHSYSSTNHRTTYSCSEFIPIVQ